MSDAKQLRANLDQGSSANEQTDEPVWVETPTDVLHSRKQYVGWRDPELGYNTRREPRVGDDLLHMTANLQQGQYERGLMRQRGMPGKQDFPDGTPRNYPAGTPSGRIKASMQYGLGSAYARPGPSDDQHLDNPPTDYIRHPEGLDKYVGAKSVLRDSEFGSGYPQEHAASQFPVMGEDILDGFNYGGSNQ